MSFTDKWFKVLMRRPSIIIVAEGTRANGLLAWQTKIT